MWGKVFDILKRIFTINDELKKLQADSDLHSEQIREIIATQTRFYYEYQLQRERDAMERERELHKHERALAQHEQDKLLLENQLLRERLEGLSLLSKPPDEPSRD